MAPPKPPSSAWPATAATALTDREGWVVLLNLIPVGILAGLRAVFWILNIPMGRWWNRCDSSCYSWRVTAAAAGSTAGTASTASTTTSAATADAADARKKEGRTYLDGVGDSKVMSWGELDSKMAALSQTAGLDLAAVARAGDANADGDGDGSTSAAALIARMDALGARTMPHAHGRCFITHLAGVAKILEAWGQPPLLCACGFAHSVYSTSMFPKGLFTFDQVNKPTPSAKAGRERRVTVAAPSSSFQFQPPSRAYNSLPRTDTLAPNLRPRAFEQRAELRQLLGYRGEMLVYLYCTVGQNAIYAEVRRCLEKGGGALPSAGFPVTNCHSGERLLLPARAAANLLVVLAADLCEQDSAVLTAPRDRVGRSAALSWPPTSPRRASTCSRISCGSRSRTGSCWPRRRATRGATSSRPAPSLSTWPRSPSGQTTSESRRRWTRA